MTTLTLLNYFQSIQFILGDDRKLCDQKHVSPMSKNNHEFSNLFRLEFSSLYINSACGEH